MHPCLHNSLSRGFARSSRLDCRTCRIWSSHFRSTGSLSIAHRSAWLAGRRVCWTMQLLLRNRLSELYQATRVRWALPRRFLVASSGNAAPFFNFRTFSVTLFLSTNYSKCLFPYPQTAFKKKMLCFPNNFYLIFYFFKIPTLDLFLIPQRIVLPPHLPIPSKYLLSVWFT